MTFTQYFDSLLDKRVAVVGIGVSNMPLARLLLDHGCDVTICDKRSEEELCGIYGEFFDRGAKFRLGESYLDELDYDVIFRTPGLHPMFLQKARENGAVITSEMEAFFQLCPCKILAVTGSDGKTTTTTLIAKFLEAEGKTVYLGGNIGTPLLDKIPEMKEDDYAVLELSSFQLHGMNCRPDVAVITNVSPNHLDVHPDLEDYVEAKRSIFRQQGADERLVLNADNAVTRGFAAEASSKVCWFSLSAAEKSGYYFDGENICRGEEKLIRRSDILLPGMHNVDNFMTALAATEGLVSLESVLSVAGSFGGVEHRIELIREFGGVKYYNDSIASSPTRTIAGLRSFEQKLILIAGGHDKHIPFDGLAAEILQRVKALFLTGETAEAIRDAVLAAPGYDAEKLPVFVIDDFKDAVNKAKDYAESGDIVILSPACSSFDKFKNFVERGNTFRRIVEEF